jgi:hypothetical protein
LTSRVDQTTPEPLDLPTRGSVVTIEETTPPSIAERDSLPRRIHDVGEQDRREHPLCVLGGLPGLDLLLRPCERLHVLGGGSLVSGSVGEEDHPRVERSCTREREIRRVGPISEQVLPASQNHRVDQEPVLVDEAMRRQRVDQVGTAVDE